MSGGVDSSVAAALLKDAYFDSHGRICIGEGKKPEPRYSNAFDVTGVYIKCYNVDGCSETDAEDARRVAEQLGISFYSFDFEEEYKQRVVEYMVDGYKKGITPNPDVMCNKEIKFGLFLKKALELGADYVATGHYVRIKNHESRIMDRKNKKPLFIIHNSLFTAVDKNKDQSYFLWTLTQDQLKHCLFPIGEYIKPQVRELAKKYELLTAEKKDSQGICFLGKVSIADFLKKYIPEKPGNVLNVKGRYIGRHKGSYFYTIGQRQGLDSGAWKRSGKGDSQPFYVVSKDVIKNTVTVVEGDSDPTLFTKEVKLVNVNLINPIFNIQDSQFNVPVLARVRYRQPLAKAKLMALNMEHGIWTKNQKIISTEDVLDSELQVPGYMKLIFDAPQQYVAEGQSAVFYSEDGEMLGGGVIVE